MQKQRQKLNHLCSYSLPVHWASFLDPQIAPLPAFPPQRCGPSSSGLVGDAWMNGWMDGRKEGTTEREIEKQTNI